MTSKTDRAIEIIESEIFDKNHLLKCNDYYLKTNDELKIDITSLENALEIIQKHKTEL